MKIILADTSALIALANKRDNFHVTATALYKSLITQKYRFLTHTAVLNEFANHLAEVQYKSLVIQFIDSIKNSTIWEIKSINPISHKGFKLYQDMDDKDWSLTDCISIHLARERKITQILTTDHHFEQAGFEILLK